jgi:hypothetical protein
MVPSDHSSIVPGGATFETESIAEGPEGLEGREVN